MLARELLSSWKSRKLDRRVITLKDGELKRYPYFFDLCKRTQNIDGDVVECGVGWGKSITMISTALDQLGIQKNITGFDSFEGFPEPHKSDLSGKAKKGHYKVSHSEVRQRLNSFSSHTQSIQLVQGFVEDTLNNWSGKISLLHIDLDIYNAYKTALDRLYKHVSKGGIIAFDEYQSEEKWPGAKKAVDEFIAESGEALVKSELINRYYIIKRRED